MATTSKYFVTLSPGSNLLDFDLAYGALSLQGQDIVFTGTNGIDNVTVAPGVIFDFTKSNGGIDSIYLTGNLADYTKAFTTSTLTLSRGTGASAESVLLTKGTSTNYDTVVFANGSVSTFDLHAWAAGGAIPTLGAVPALPTPLNATVKGFALDATGEVFTGTAPGVNFIATGGNGVDIVYVKAGATVDASKLNSGEDKIYFTGNWVDYTKAATTSKITFTNATTGDAVVVAAATGASNDRLVFADGYVLSNDAKTSLLANASVAISAVTGFSTAELTPLPGPSVTITTNDNALKIGDTATLTFTLSEAPVTNLFASTDVTVAGGALSNFAGSGTSYTASFTPAADSTTPATVNVVGGAFTNAGGQNNVAAQQLSMTVDTIAPVAATIDAVATDDIIDSAERIAGVTVTGTNETGTTVTLNGNAVTAVSGTTWSYNLSTAAIDAFGQGAETLTVVSTDAVGNATTATRNITVTTPAITFGTTTISEAAANDGSITATSLITLVNDTFNGADATALTGVTFSNVPTGLTAVITKNSATTATLSFTGSAVAHANANDVANLTVTMANSTFAGGSAAAVMGATTSNLAIDFADPLVRTVSYDVTTFSEAGANDGSIATTATLTITGDTFTGTDGQALTGATVTNVPTGLTAVLTKTSATTATLTLTGNAVAHNNANDVINLTVTMGSTTFTNDNVASVVNATKSNLVIDFADPVRTLSYGTTTFSEAGVNDGSITATSLITLTGDTFTGTNGVALTGATVTNVPAGLTATITKNSATTATLSFTGSATAHANANDIANLTVTMGNTAFTLGNAAGVTGATTSNLAVDFADPRAVSYGTTTFSEAVANDGSITATSTITLTGDTFTGTDGLALSGAVVSNAPNGLTAVVTKTSATTATLSFTGNALAHANANDISNLTVTLGNAAFTGSNAAGVAGATTSNLVVDFADPVRTLSYGTTTFNEASTNDGSITATSLITLSGDTFAGANGAALTGAVVSNVPAGLTAVITKNSATTATLSFTGSATAHANANDIANLTVTMGNSTFTLGNAAGVTGATTSNLAVDFADPRSVSYSATTLQEAGANDGSITTTSTITLTGDTFTGTDGLALTGAVVSNVPNGLTAVLTKTSATTATLSLTGNAVAHSNVNDISNLTVTLGNGAFTQGNAAGVTGSTTSNLVVDFIDVSPRSVSYGTATFNEAIANDGSITTTSTITLTGDTFTGANSAVLGGVTFSNVPTGLTAVVTKTDAATATLSLTGNAAAHANVNDIANLTVVFGDSAFAGGNAATVTGSTKSNLSVNFADSIIDNGTVLGDTLNGTAAADIIYGLGGPDIINGEAGNDTIDITDPGATAFNSATIRFTSTANGTDTIVGFNAAATANGGDVLDFSSIAALTDAVATGQTLATDFAANNVFVFDGTAVTIASAASAIAADVSVVATAGYIVIADSGNNNRVTVYHSTDLAANGTETALAILSGVTIANLTAANFVV